MKNLWKYDKIRGGALPIFQYWLRKASAESNPFLLFLYKSILSITLFPYSCEMYSSMKIGPGLCITHPFGNTLNPDAIIGANCSIHKEVTVGIENRGKRKGCPVIGNEVWIGIMLLSLVKLLLVMMY